MIIVNIGTEKNASFRLIDVIYTFGLMRLMALLMVSIIRCL